MMSQPTLRTDRLVLEPLADHHLELEVALDADAEVMRFLTGRAATREEVLASHARRRAAARDGLGFWIGHSDEGFAGLMMLPPGDEPGTAELGYRLARRQWRRGLATEASRALVEHAFATAGVRRVFAQTMAVNAGSQGVMRAAGLRYVRTFFPAWDDPLPGSDRGEVEYEITREMWGAAGR